MEAQVDLSSLTPVERELLRLGIAEWERPEGDREAAVDLLGYGDRRELSSDVQRLAGLLDASRPMSRRDCRRLLLATELAFASETLGWSRDWTPFHQRFAFRPGMRSWPAIEEPRPSVTFDLGPLFAGSHAQFAAGADAINSLTLLALIRVLDPDTSVVVLDWQHQTYRFRPHLFACQSDQQWPTTVFPNGDYYIFLTDDMSTGTFGHPWEQTLCVFGEQLMSALVPTLTSWLPVKRSNR
jgi:hypothetical protein